MPNFGIFNRKVLLLDPKMCIPKLTLFEQLFPVNVLFSLLLRRCMPFELLNATLFVMLL